MNKKFTIHLAFLGPQGSYSHYAAIKYAKNCLFNKKIVEHKCLQFNEIIQLVENQHAEYGILPIENSNTGLIKETYHLLINSNLISIDEITIPVKHCILTNINTSLNQIQIVYSHLQPIKQCSNFLKYFSKWKIILCKSSSTAIQIVAKFNQPNIAAVGSIQGGILYGLHPLIYNISNNYTNMTKFLILKNKI